MTNEHKNKPAGRPKGIQNRNSLTVRMALNKLGFDAVTEWVKCVEQIEDPAVKLAAIENMMKYMYPRLKEMEVTPSEILDMEQQDIMELKPADIPTDQLLEAVSEQKTEKKGE